MRSWGLLLLGLALWGLSGCAPPPEIVHAAGDGHRATNESIDAEPWGLLPGGAVVWLELDKLALDKAPFGRELNEIVRDYLPLPEAERESFLKGTERVRVGVYASAHGDVAGVLSGRFRPELVQKNLGAHAATAKGGRIEHATFAGHPLLQADGNAVTVLTPNTAVLGTVLGVRRVLERIEEGRVRSALPSWFSRLLETKNSSMALGIDLDAEPVPATLRAEVELLDGIRGAQVLGNFRSPGLNVAGTLSYDGAQSARRARELAESMVDSVSRASFLLSLLKVGRPIRRFEAREDGRNLQFAAELDGNAVSVGVHYVLEQGSALGLQ